MVGDAHAVMPCSLKSRLRAAAFHAARRLSALALFRRIRPLGEHLNIGRISRHRAFKTYRTGF